MPFLDFRTEVADAIIKVGKSANLNVRKRGRSSLENAEEDNSRHPVKRAVAPSTEVRLDKFDHLPSHSEKRGRCRLCKSGFTSLTCLKCKVLLCLTKERNCFVQYHTQK